MATQNNLLKRFLNLLIGLNAYIRSNVGFTIIEGIRTKFLIISLWGLILGREAMNVNFRATLIRSNSREIREEDRFKQNDQQENTTNHGLKSFRT